MHRDVISTDQEAESSSLADRLDSSIGETSSGIGAMLSELLRRSLKAGVSDIGESLGEYAGEQVEAAVEQKMPEVAEAADEVAESTARRVINERERLLQSQIAEAADSAINRSKTHADQIFHRVEESVTHVQSSLDETRHFASQRNEAAERKIDELQDKARATWRKVKQEFAVLKEAHEQSRADQKKLHAALRHTQHEMKQQSEQSAQRLAAISRQCERLAERLAVLEQPRGIKAVWAKFGRKQKPTEKLDSSDKLDSNEQPTSDRSSSQVDPSGSTSSDS